MKKQTQQCSGEPLINKQATGGHVEDYITDPNKKSNYSVKMEWVKVNSFFKKD